MPHHDISTGTAKPASSRPLAVACLRSGSVSAPALLPAPAPVLHMSAPVRRGAVADARLGLACQCARVLLSDAASTIRIAHNAALTVSARSAAGDRSCGLANTGMCAKVWTWLVERLLAVPCSLVHAPSLVHVCLFREQNAFCRCAELETKVDQSQWCLQLTAGVGWSSRGSKVCVTMLALQCQC